MNTIKEFIKTHNLKLAAGLILSAVADYLRGGLPLSGLIFAIVGVLIPTGAKKTQ